MQQHHPSRVQQVYISVDLQLHEEMYKCFTVSAVMYMRSALFWLITQHRVAIPYRRFGTAYRSHLQGSRNPRRKSSWNLKMELKGCPEMLVMNYHFKPQISQKSADLEEQNTSTQLSLLVCLQFKLLTWYEMSQICACGHSKWSDSAGITDLRLVGFFCMV